MITKIYTRHKPKTAPLCYPECYPLLFIAGTAEDLVIIRNVLHEFVASHLMLSVSRVEYRPQ